METATTTTDSSDEQHYNDEYRRLRTLKSQTDVQEVCVSICYIERST